MHLDVTPPEGGAWLPVYGKGNLLAEYALVDVADFSRLAQFIWRLDSDGYAFRRAKRPDGVHYRHPLASEVMQLENGGADRLVDHIDLEPLNCRRGNLRVVTRLLNAQNRASHRGSTSRFRNVSWNSKTSKWHASVYSRGQCYWIGVFDDELEAAQAAQRLRGQLMPAASALY